MMSTFEAISLMIAFAMLLVTLLAYIDRINKRIQQKVRMLALFDCQEKINSPMYLAGIR